MTTRERRRQARALWQKACATWACGIADRVNFDHCALWNSMPGDGYQSINGVPGWSNRGVHMYCASALLDGLSCEDLP